MTRSANWAKIYRKVSLKTKPFPLVSCNFLLFTYWQLRWRERATKVICTWLSNLSVHPNDVRMTKKPWEEQQQTVTNRFFRFMFVWFIGCFYPSKVWAEQVAQPRTKLSPGEVWAFKASQFDHLVRQYQFIIIIFCFLLLEHKGLSFGPTTKPKDRHWVASSAQLTGCEGFKEHK